MDPRASGVTRVLLCRKERLLRGEMSVAHADTIPAYNPQVKALSIPAIT